MKRIRVIAAARLLAALLFLPLGVHSEPRDTHSLSPYFQIVSEATGEIETLPLESTSVEVKIAGVIADVRVEQVYRNRGTNPIDAVYVFPGSARAAVYGMRMRIGGRVITAKIKERIAARNEFQRAKSEGKRVSLLEQQRPNVFQMNVANILPGDQVSVELRYTEIIVPEKGVYEFVYPAVVGPRYSETPAAGAPDTETWVANPYLNDGQNTPYAFDIDVSLNASLPIHALQSSSHDVDIRFEGKGRARIALSDTEQNGGDRDYILEYRLVGDRIESGVLLHEGMNENFFLLMTQPPRRVVPERIPPREYQFVVDVSGSMHGFPLETTKHLMAELLGGLRPVDRFNILFFSGSSSVLSERSLPATPENLQSALRMLDRIQGSGGTRLLPALRQAMRIEAEPGTARSFVVVTDGYISVEADVFDFVRAHLGQANFFAFGIGSSVNRYLIEGLARAGRGEPFIMTSPGQARTLAERFREYIEAPLLTGIEIDFGAFDVYDVQPDPTPDLFAERPLIVFGKWRGRAEGLIRIRGQQGDTRFEQSVDIARDGLSEDNLGLRYLWARQRIAELGDFQKVSPDSATRESIKSLGLAYNLLTAYTSFIAVDERIVDTDGAAQTVRQPLPLPAGVSSLAVAGAVPTTPEPEMSFLMVTVFLWVLGIAGVQFYRNRALGIQEHG